VKKLKTVNSTFTSQACQKSRKERLGIKVMFTNELDRLLAAQLSKMSVQASDVSCFGTLRKLEYLAGVTFATEKVGKSDLRLRFSVTTDLISRTNFKNEMAAVEIAPSSTFTILWATTYFPISGTKVSDTVLRIVFKHEASMVELVRALQKGAPN